MVRPLVSSDREAIERILVEVGIFTAAEIACALEQVDIYLQVPGQKDYRLVVIENSQAEVAGFISYGPTPLTEGTYDLYWVAVSPQNQRKGYGQILLQYLEKQVEKEKGRMVLIETSSQPKYSGTRSFYENLGYREIARVPDFYRPGDDRITYLKRFEEKKEK
ncbi:MAG: GNAT family N-acetyltransferase [Candidatus Aminicenantales bacterium]